MPSEVTTTTTHVPREPDVRGGSARTRPDRHNAWRFDLAGGGRLQRACTIKFSLGRYPPRHRLPDARTRDPGTCHDDPTDERRAESSNHRDSEPLRARYGSNTNQDDRTRESGSCHDRGDRARLGGRIGDGFADRADHGDDCRVFGRSSHPGDAWHNDRPQRDRGLCHQRRGHRRLPAGAAVSGQWHIARISGADDHFHPLRHPRCGDHESRSLRRIRAHDRFKRKGDPLFGRGHRVDAWWAFTSCRVSYAGWRRSS